MGTSVVFMPRIDLWAVETINEVAEGSNSSSILHQEPMEEDPQPVEKENGSSQQQSELSETAEDTITLQSISHIWSSFVEHVESICVSTSLIILATSEVPLLELPDRLIDFFKSDVPNCSQRTTLEHTVPRFTVDLGSNFNHDMVIKLSAAELSRDILQSFVHLIHQRSHAQEAAKRKHSIHTFAAGENDNTNPGLACEVGSQSCGDLRATVPAPPTNNRIWKGKSSLMLAISSFGYQILRCPHFAELCWVTSKLKEGPSSEIGGPCKGWPFNSCIIRPTNSSDKASVASGSSNVKSKEKFGLVRGLIAVGLKAYQGLYTSLREISSEVRKVLELLVGWINAKVNTGKDRYQYVHILSQVAYLEDMVNSWVYSLQSLDQDIQIKAASPNPYALGSQENNVTHVNDTDQIKEYGPQICPEFEGLGTNTKEYTVQNMELIDLNKKDGGEEKVELFEKAVLGLSGNTNSEEQPIGHVDEPNWTSRSPCVSESTRSPMVEGDSTAENIDSVDLNKMDYDCAPSHEGKFAAVEAVENISLGGNTVSTEHHNFPVGNDLFPVDKQSVTMPGSSGSVSTRNPMLVGDPRSPEQCNGFAPTENGFCSLEVLNGAKLSGSGEACNQINVSETEFAIASEDREPEDQEHQKDPNCSSTGTALPAESEVACFYRCCPVCLHTLLSLMQKILLKEWKSDGSCWTVDDVYDTVALLSMNILSTVRKVYAARCSSDKSTENPGNKNHGKQSNHPEWNRCACKSSEDEDNFVIPTECRCHSAGTIFPNIQVEFDPVFVCRDGVMVPIDSSKEDSFHCKFSTLCLCSLLESISMTKQPSD